MTSGELSAISARSDAGRALREALRLRCFRAWRERPGVSSVSVQVGGSGALYLRVGVTETVELPVSFEGVDVRAFMTAPARYALDYA